MNVCTEKFDAIKVQVEAMVAKYKESEIDSLAKAFAFVHGIVPYLTKLVEVSSELVKGEDKREAVIEAVKYAYMQSNPDLPWIPEPFETKVEEWILEAGVPSLVDMLVNYSNDTGVFEHGTTNKIVVAGNVVDDADAIPMPELDL